jgi:signal transduction histidine kinase
MRKNILLPMAIVLVLLGCCAIYFLVIWLFKRELTRAEYEITKETVQSFQDSLNDSIGNMLVGPTGVNNNFDRALEKLLENHQNVIFIMITDSNRRIRNTTQIKSKYNDLENLIAGQTTDSGVVNKIREKYPQIKAERWALEFATGIVLHLSILIDMQSSHEVIDRATTAMYPKLVRSVLLATVLVILIFIGMLRQKRTADRLRKQRDDAERMAYVGTLASGLAHEIRNPINAQAMQLELLEEDVEKGEINQVSVVQRLHRVRDGLSRLERSVQDFLTFARPSDQKPTKVLLAEVIDELLEEAKDSCPDQKADLSHTVQPDIILWCDVHALRQILGNLLSNALRIQKDQPCPRIQIEARRQNQKIQIFVEDDGPGVPEASRDRVFECFFTTHSEGSGLGLAIARRLTEMNDGQLTVEANSSALKGARFSLTLPAVDQA